MSDLLNVSSQDAYSWLLAHNRRAGMALEAMKSKKLDHNLVD